jgi:hypothetical protein
MQDHLAGQASRRTFLTGEEAERRKLVLVRLQDALAAEGVESVIVGRRGLTLRSGEPWQPCRPGDPELHVLGADRCRIVTTDGRQFRLADNRMHPAGDPRGAARWLLPADICGEAGLGVSALADDGPGGPEGAVGGAGERALRKLLADGVI